MGNKMELTLSQHMWNVFVAFVTKQHHKEQFPNFQYTIGEKGNHLYIFEPTAVPPYRETPMGPVVGDQHQIHTYSLPEDQGSITVDFHLTPQWSHIPDLFFTNCFGKEPFLEAFLMDYCEATGQFMAGVPVAVDFTDEELERIDAARALTGETREEFINTAIKKACEDLAFLSKEPTKEPNFTDKIVEALGEGSTVIYRESEDKETSTLIIGLPNHEVAVSRVDNALKVYGHDEDALKYALKELVDEDSEGLKGVAYFVINSSSDPYKVEDVHAGWLKQITYTFGLDPWTDADSKFGAED